MTRSSPPTRPERACLPDDDRHAGRRHPVPRPLQSRVRRLSLFGAAWLALATIGCAKDPAQTPSLRSDDPVAIALDRAAAYTSRKALIGDEMWMSKQGAWLLGGEFNAWGEQLFAEKRALGGQRRAILPLADLRHPRPPTIPTPVVAAVTDPIYHVSRREISQIRSMMALSIACPKLNSAKRESLQKAITKPGRSYVVTHQLWALVTGHHLGCIDDATFDELRPKLAQAVYAELLADTRFDDLMAERMAMLAYAGLVSWIPDEAFDLAVSTQDPTGGWIRHQVDIGSSATSTVMHMTSLAFYALAASWASREGTP